MIEEVILTPSASEYHSTIAQLKSDGFETCSDLCAVDYQGFAGRDEEVQRFEVVVNLLSLEKRERVRVRVQVPGNPPTLQSLYSIYPGTEAMEREAYDLFGIVFEGHPDLSRILLPEDWEGHPLRKDYVTSRVPVQFKAPVAGR